jgi:hypothetical protein
LSETLPVLYRRHARYGSGISADHRPMNVGPDFPTGFLAPGKPIWWCEDGTSWQVRAIGFEVGRIALIVDLAEA